MQDSRQYWNRHAASDPLWAVCSFDDKAGGKWDLQEFMQSGEREIALLVHRIGELGLTLRTGAALDFGCGVGRLSQALARRFDRVLGVDISDGMIDLATRLNRYDGRVRYFANHASDLRYFEKDSVSFIYSSIVLQHMEPAAARVAIVDFLRLLRPGGLLVFQLPSHKEARHEAPIHSMPADAYRARVEIPPLSALHAGESIEISVAVTNTGPKTWQQSGIGSLRLGNRWFDATGQRLVVQDDGRAVIPQSMRPTQRCEVRLVVTAPATPGDYCLDVDVVHEGVAWFASNGSTPGRLTVQVGAAADGAPVRPAAAMINELPIPKYDASLIPKPSDGADRTGLDAFPMNGIPHKEVVALIESHRGKVVHSEEDRRTGDEWKSYRYFVRR